MSGQVVDYAPFSAASKATLALARGLDGDAAAFGEAVASLRRALRLLPPGHPAEARMRILEGRRRQVEERREGLREAVARASSSFDRYTRQLHQLGLESSEREVKWLNELIAAERSLPTAEQT